MLFHLKKHVWKLIKDNFYNDVPIRIVIVMNKAMA